MAAICPHAEGSEKVINAAATATVARDRSGARVRAMPRMASPTTATAATFSPCNQPLPSASPRLESPYAKATSAIAEGSVKAVQAASAPGYPARSKPMAIPTWLEAGPGRNWQSATRSA